uniref:Uncharacterized protein n=1 Tax=Arundo donax TaxID=35708 RepID=A0A0A9C784_ARUDO
MDFQSPTRKPVRLCTWKENMHLLNRSLHLVREYLHAKYVIIHLLVH